MKNSLTIPNSKSTTRLENLMNITKCKSSDRANTMTGSFTANFLAQMSASQPRIQPNSIESPKVYPAIEGMATGTPEHIIHQADAAKFVTNLPGMERHKERIETIYKNTRIETRHLAYNFLVEPESTYNRSIQARMEAYKEYGIPLAKKVAREAIESARKYTENIEDSIRQIIFVSSTGFVGPGIDAELIARLGLRRDISRATVNFMGCAAAMNGLHLACDRVKANPIHKSLVICLELSSVNAVFDEGINDVIIHSIFADGCAAMIVGASTESQAMGTDKILIKDCLSYLVENTQDGITLGIKDNGITCQLSRQLPAYIETGIEPIIDNFLAHNGLTQADIDLWAVHPGGTRIIESVQRALDLSDAQVAHSWEILAEYGNMLSTSLLFVIERMMLNAKNAELAATASTKGLNGIAFSFSPGIGVEGILFEKV
jgi:alpha-pyrone synthase